MLFHIHGAVQLHRHRGHLTTGDAGKKNGHIGLDIGVPVVYPVIGRRTPTRGFLGRMQLSPHHSFAGIAKDLDLALARSRRGPKPHLGGPQILFSFVPDLLPGIQYRRTARSPLSRRVHAVRLIVCVVLLLTATLARADLHSGTAEIPPGTSWDFSDSAAVGYYSGDVGVVATVVHETQTAPATWLLFANYPAKLAIAPADSSFDDLTTAPEDTTLYEAVKVLLPDRVYFIRTREGNYAKLQVLSIGSGATAVYTYQDDGTRVLSGTVSVEATSWGRIKSLYR